MHVPKQYNCKRTSYSILIIIIMNGKMEISNHEQEEKQDPQSKMFSCVHFHFTKLGSLSFDFPVLIFPSL